MRFAFFLGLGILLWAGTVSIKYPQQPFAVTESSGHPCSDQSHGDQLMTYLKIGTITSIHDNGRILTVQLSPQWETLPPHKQKQTYNAVVCYAQSQHRPFRFLMSKYI